MLIEDASLTEQSPPYISKKKRGLTDNPYIINHMWWASKERVHKLYPKCINIGYSEEDIKKLCSAVKKKVKQAINSPIKALIYSMSTRLHAIHTAGPKNIKPNIKIDRSSIYLPCQNALF